MSHSDYKKNWKNLTGFAKTTFKNLTNGRDIPDQAVRVKNAPESFKKAVEFVIEHTVKENDGSNIDLARSVKAASDFVTYSLQNVGVVGYCAKVKALMKAYHEARNSFEFMDSSSEENQTNGRPKSNAEVSVSSDDSNKSFLARKGPTFIKSEFAAAKLVPKFSDLSVVGKNTANTRSRSFSVAFEKSSRAFPPPDNRKRSADDVCEASGEDKDTCPCELCCAFGVPSTSKSVDAHHDNYKELNNFHKLETFWREELTGKWTKRSMTALQFLALNLGDHPDKFEADPNVGYFFEEDGLNVNDITAKLEKLKKRSNHQATDFLKTEQFIARTILVEYDAPGAAPIQFRNHYMLRNFIDVDVELLGRIKW
jgi:hypothetical protein